MKNPLAIEERLWATDFWSVWIGGHPVSRFESYDLARDHFEREMFCWQDTVALLSPTLTIIEEFES